MGKYTNRDQMRPNLVVRLRQAAQKNHIDVIEYTEESFNALLSCIKIATVNGLAIKMIGSTNCYTKELTYFAVLMRITDSVFFSGVFNKDADEACIYEFNNDSVGAFQHFLELSVVAKNPETSNKYL
jgi:hypothetical protein